MSYLSPEGASSDASYLGFSAAQVLLSLRDQAITDWIGLCREFGVSPNGRGTPTERLRGVISLLESAGLIEFDKINGRLAVSERLPYVQLALGISIKQLASIIEGQTILVTPVFGFVAPVTPFDVFALMPFRPEFDDLYERVLRPVATTLGLTLSRADELFGPTSIINDIWTSIVWAKVVIADCTDRNPNVFYEIGLAHAIGKSVVLITQNDDDVPFDLKHLRYIKYSLTPSGADLLSGQLRQTFQTLIN